VSPFYFVVPTFGNPCLGLLSAPKSMYSTVGPTFGSPCLGLLSCPNSMYGNVDERCLHFILLSLLGSPCLGLLSAPKSMYSTGGESCLHFILLSLLSVIPVSACYHVPTVLYSTVGERCLCFRFVVPTFQNPCLGLLSGPNITVQYCWREVSLFLFVLFLLSVVPLLVCFQIGLSL
jgi:hypothetical protein